MSPEATLKDFDPRTDIQVWKHKKTGHLYNILIVTNLYGDDLEKFPPTVVYSRKRSIMTWSRPISVFVEKFELECIHAR